MLCRQYVWKKSAGIRTLATNHHNSWDISPKVHAYRFVATPEDAFSRFKPVANRWRPKGLSKSVKLEWTCSKFALIYYPLWYACAETRQEILCDDDTSSFADISLFGGLPGKLLSTSTVIRKTLTSTSGHVDDFLSLCLSHLSLSQEPTSLGDSELPELPSYLGEARLPSEQAVR